MIHHAIGSVWRKWDLHFHTPSSYDYHDRSLSNATLIESLVSAGIRVVAITDHHQMDVERIAVLQKISNGRITILPGIELCSELGGSNSVHFIGLFHEDTNVPYIWRDISVHLKLTTEDIKDRGGYERIYTDIRHAAKIIHKHHGLVSIHAGTKSNSLETISNRDLFKQTIKADLLKDGVVDILEIGKLDDFDDYCEIVFPALGEHFPLVVGSDNHRASEYSVKANCWIKADPSFYGLLQTLVEPQTRIFIGERPEKRRKVTANRTKYIRSVQIAKKDHSALEEYWFDGTNIRLNHDLVAIIGNKGTGKSALAEVIGLLGSSRNESSFDFLNSQRFRTPKNNRSEHFEATLNWENGSADACSLAEAIDRNNREKVKFIPQGLFEEICNDIAVGKENKFDEELEKVIFSHVGDADRLGKDSLRDLLDYLTNETYDAIKILKSQLHGLNISISQLEHRIEPEYRQTIENLLDGKQDELEAHEQAIPEEVSRPKTSPESASPETAAEILEEKKRLEQLKSELKAANDLENQSARQVSAANRALGQISNFQEEFRIFKQDLSDELETLELSIDEVVQFKLNSEPIQERQRILEDVRSGAKVLQHETNPEALPQRIRKTEEKIRALQDKLDEPTKLYEGYQTQLSEWRLKKEQLIGTPDKSETIAYYEAQLQDLVAIPEKLETEKSRRLDLTREIYGHIKKLVATFEELYQPVQTFSENYGLSDDTFQLKFDVSIVDTGIEDKFFNWIARNRVGSFYGNGEMVLKRLLERFDFNAWEDVETFLEELLNHLQYDLRQTSETRAKISDQLRQAQDVVTLYDYIFSLDYLRPRYVLKLDDKEIGQLSPGERGALLLVFYLLVDRDDIPLVIDQPEENLDNQTVYQRLVSAIKAAKERRQILVVTHNPNLAVVCDAEQIICCDIDKKNGNRINYVSGSIENPEINAAIIDILEGTKPAFNNRRLKYAPFERFPAKHP